MKIQYNVQSRKQLADEIGNILNNVPKYLGVPTCNYQIADCILDRHGLLTIPNEMEQSIAARLIATLREKGYEGESQQEEQDHLIISLPRDGFTEQSLANLRQLVQNREELMKRALGVESLPIVEKGEKVSFPWFPYTTDGDEIKAYAQFVAGLANLARRQKRVSKNPVTTDNDRFTFRTFLIRLGMVGEEYKKARKILLRNLAGNSAFRHGR